MVELLNGCQIPKMKNETTKNETMVREYIHIYIYKKMVDERNVQRSFAIWENNDK